MPANRKNSRPAQQPHPKRMEMAGNGGKTENYFRTFRRQSALPIVAQAARDSGIG